MRGPADFCVSIDWYFATPSSRPSSFKLSLFRRSVFLFVVCSLCRLIHSSIALSCSSGRDVEAVAALPLQRREAHRRPLALPDVPVRDCNTTHIASSELLDLRKRLCTNAQRDTGGEKETEGSGAHRRVASPGPGAWPSAPGSSPNPSAAASACHKTRHSDTRPSENPRTALQKARRVTHGRVCASHSPLGSAGMSRYPPRA